MIPAVAIASKADSLEIKRLRDELLVKERALEAAREAAAAATAVATRGSTPGPSSSNTKLAPFFSSSPSQVPENSSVANDLARQLRDFASTTQATLERERAELLVRATVAEKVNLKPASISTPQY